MSSTPILDEYWPNEPDKEEAYKEVAGKIGHLMKEAFHLGMDDEFNHSKVPSGEVIYNRLHFRYTSKAYHEALEPHLKHVRATLKKVYMCGRQTEKEIVKEVENE